MTLPPAPARGRCCRSGGLARAGLAVLTVLTGLTGLAGLTACSSGGGDGGAATPQVAVETFFHAIGDKDPAAACSVVSTGGARLSGTPLDQCKIGFEKVLDTVQDQGDIALLKGAKVTGATVMGEKATILAAQITKVPEGFQNDIDLVRLDGRWFIDSKTDTSRGTDTTPPAAPTG